MSTKDVVSCIAAELKAQASDLLLPAPPPLDASKSYQLLHAYVLGHPYHQPPPPSAGANQSSSSSAHTNEKLASELVLLFRNTFASKDNQHSHSRSGSLSRLTAEQVSAQDTRLLVFAAWLRRLLPIYDPSRFVADWWEALLRPVLATARWRPLLDICNEIATELVTSTQWPTAGVSTEEKQPMDKFRATVAREYLNERISVWEREQSVQASQQYLPTSRRGSVDRIGAFWDTVGGANYERVLIGFGIHKPKEFFDLLNEFCLAKRTRLHVLVFLAKFVRREEAPCYFFVDSTLFRTILISAMKDEKPSVLTASISLLTALLPSVVARLAENLDHLLGILVRMIYWEASFSLIYKLALTSNPDPRQVASVPGNDNELSTHISFSARAILNEYTYVTIRQIVGHYYTLLYGMFPCNTVDFVRSYLAVKSRKFLAECAPLQDPAFELSEDPFITIRQKMAALDNYDEDSICADRFMGLLASHRVHPDLVKSDATRERDNLKNIRISPSDLVMRSLDLQSGTAFGADNRAPRHQHHDSIASLESLPDTLALPPAEHTIVSNFAILQNQSTVASHLFPLPNFQERDAESPLNLDAIQMGDTTPRRSAPATPKLTPVASLPAATASPEKVEKVPQLAAQETNVQVEAGPEAPTTCISASGLGLPDLDAILQINRKLRLALFNVKEAELGRELPAITSLVTLASDQTRSFVAELLELHLMLLLNQVNYQAFMRWHHYQHIRKLKKDQMQDDLAEADRQSVFEKLKVQHQEIAVLHESLNRQRQESASMRERQRRHEEDLTQRAKTAKRELATQQEFVVQLQRELDDAKAAHTTMAQQCSQSDRRISELQTELDSTKPDLEKLAECEKTIAGLTATILDRDSGAVIAENYRTEKTQLVERIVGLQMQLRDAERELAAVKADLVVKNDAAETALAAATRAEAVAERLEREAGETSRAFEHVQVATAARVAAVEDKYQTTRRINMQLEARIADLLTEAPECAVCAAAASGVESDPGEAGDVPVRIGHYR
ncbi:hypothetical protein HDU87_003100 [Geranomyces variabilis]|uniref:Hamartin n=1 Tax=Geranomyces variabilis TaxID=109894 RepID=A0AAD5TMU1_9FUNG|nr:hypothetical protein HDU87_003100 [Geranomyces variabilis]